MWTIKIVNNNPTITYKELVDQLNITLIEQGFSQHPELNGNPSLYNEQIIINPNSSNEEQETEIIPEIIPEEEQETEIVTDNPTTSSKPSKKKKKTKIVIGIILLGIVLSVVFNM